MRNLKDLRINNRRKLIVPAFFLVLIYFTSCNKSWTCTIPTYNIKAIKGTDTILNGVVIGTGSGFDDNQSYFEGLVSYYGNNGYSVIIDTSVASQTGIVDQSSLKALEDNGFKCMQ